MTKARNQPKASAATTMRCAIYTRKSTEDGLEQEFNSLDAQRESGEAFIKSQAHEGWTCVADHYDDGGFTGGNMDRPALQTAAGRHRGRADRLRRGLQGGPIEPVAARLRPDDGDVREASGLVRLGDPAVQHGQFDGAAHLERAAFVRPVRARDDQRADPRQDRRRPPQRKMGRRNAAAGLQRRRHEARVEPDEAEQVRQIFGLYLDHDGLIPVVEELERRGWRTKRWTTRKGTERGGRPFDKNSLWSFADEHHLHRQAAVQGRGPRRRARGRSSGTTSGGGCSPSSSETAGPGARRCGTASARSSRG